MPTRLFREGYRFSDRVDALSYEAEALYARLILTVDDFGRYYGDPDVIRAACFPRRIAKGHAREVTADQIERSLVECEGAGLILRYSITKKGVVGRFLILFDFDQRVRSQRSKFPDPPLDELPVQIDEKPLENRPGAILAGKDGLDVFVFEDAVGVESSSKTSSPAYDPPAEFEGTPLQFQTVGNTALWPLRRELFEELQKLFPSVNVGRECLLAIAKLKSGAVPKKTARGMPKFLFAWMGRENDRPRYGPGSSNGNRRPAPDVVDPAVNERFRKALERSEP